MARPKRILIKTKRASDRSKLSQAALALFTWSCLAVCAQAAQPVDPFDLSLEQLTTMEVRGVSKSVERELDAPAAVTVVTGDDIRAFGWRTLADVLNAAPGFFTYGDRAFNYVGVRGFAPVESYNSRVLLLIDGFPSNETIYQQALIGNEMNFDLDLVDRIEIIPGPSSSVYGTNAFLGVINVILKNPSQVNSGAKAWVGSGAERGVSARFSATAGEDTRYLLQVTDSGMQGLDVTFAPQAGMPEGGRVSGTDGTDVARAFGKIISGNLRVNLGFSERRQGAGFGLYGDVIGDPRSWVRDGTSFADIHFDGIADSTTDYVLRASLAEYRNDEDIVDSYPNVPGFPPVVPGFLTAVGDWIDTEATATHHFSANNRLVFGTEVRRNLREDMTFANDVQGTFLRVSDAETHAALYAQNDMDWSTQWATSIGLRDDADTGQPNRLSPRLALIWKPAGDQVVKLLSGSAFRDPGFFEKRFEQLPLNLPNTDLRSERVQTLDLEYQAQLSERSNISVTAFRYHAFDLINNVVLDSAGTLQYQNIDTARARGIDLAFDSLVLPTLRGRLSMEYVSTVDADGNWAQNSPRWTGRLGIDQTLPANWHLGAEGLFEGTRQNVDGTTLPAVFVGDLSLSTNQHSGRPDFTVGIYNLFNRTYAQPVDGWPVASVNQPARTWRATVGYTF
jgi:iron complex outermembrane receptor protein